MRKRQNVSGNVTLEQSTQFIAYTVQEDLDGEVVVACLATLEGQVLP